MTTGQRVALASLAALAALAGVTACDSGSLRGPDLDPPTDRPVVVGTNLPPDQASVYVFQVELDGRMHDCVAYDGGNDGGIYCTPIGGGR